MVLVFLVVAVITGALTILHSPTDWLTAIIIAPIISSAAVVWVATLKVIVDEVRLPPRGLRECKSYSVSRWAWVMRKDEVE